MSHLFVPILTDIFNQWFAQGANSGSVTKGVITLLKKGGQHVWEELDCSITSHTKVSKWGSQYYLNRNLGPYFHLGQGMLSQNPSPLTLLSFLLSPFLSRSPSPSAQSAERVELPKTTQEQEKREPVAEEIPDTKHAC